jgi:hypothetical protein
MQKQAVAKITTVPSEPLLASFKVAYRIAKRRKPHLTGDSLVLPAATDKVMLDES